MVAIRHWEAENFLAKPPGHIAFYLFYGTDAGLISERARTIVKASIDNPDDAFQLVRIEGDELSGETGRLADEVNTIGLFGGRRAIWVKAGARNLVAGCSKPSWNQRRRTPLSSSKPGRSRRIRPPKNLRATETCRGGGMRARHAGAIAPTD